MRMRSASSSSDDDGAGASAGVEESCGVASAASAPVGPGASDEEFTAALSDLFLEGITATGSLVDPDTEAISIARGAPCGWPPGAQCALK